eukprot:s1286_g1.t1
MQLCWIPQLTQLAGHNCLESVRLHQNFNGEEKIARYFLPCTWSTGEGCEAEDGCMWRNGFGATASMPRPTSYNASCCIGAAWLAPLALLTPIGMATLAPSVPLAASVALAAALVLHHRHGWAGMVQIAGHSRWDPLAWAFVGYNGKPFLVSCAPALQEPNGIMATETNLAHSI